MSILKQFLMRTQFILEQQKIQHELAQEAIQDWFTKNLKRFKEIAQSFQDRKDLKYVDNVSTLLTLAKKDDPSKYGFKVVTKGKKEVYILQPSGAAKLLKDPDLLKGAVLTGSAVAGYIWSLSETPSPITTLKKASLNKQFDGIEKLISHMKTVLGNFDQFTTDYVYRHKLVNILMEDSSIQGILYYKDESPKDRMQFSKWKPGSKEGSRPKEYQPSRFSSAKDAGYTADDIREIYNRFIGILKDAGDLASDFQKRVIKIETPDQKQEFAAIMHSSSAMSILDEYLTYFQKTSVPALLNQMAAEETYKLPK